jgi:release factor glutamine methyltransferase
LVINQAWFFFNTQVKSCKLLDLGTGSGIIAITLADKNPHWQVVATDFSKQSLSLPDTSAVCGS